MLVWPGISVGGLTRSQPAATDPLRWMHAHASPPASAIRAIGSTPSSAGSERLDRRPPTGVWPTGFHAPSSASPVARRARNNRQDARASVTASSAPAASLALETAADPRGHAAQAKGAQCLRVNGRHACGFTGGAAPASRSKSLSRRDST